VIKPETSNQASKDEIRFTLIHTMKVTLILVRFSFVTEQLCSKEKQDPQQSTNASLPTERKSGNLRENNKEVICPRNGTPHLCALIKITSAGKGNVLAWLCLLSYVCL
jgi:hypothetical protein